MSWSTAFFLHPWEILLINFPSILESKETCINDVVSRYFIENVRTRVRISHLEAVRVSYTFLAEGHKGTVHLQNDPYSYKPSEKIIRQCRHT